MLVNEGGTMLDVCLLGTGGMLPLPDRWLTSLLLRYNGKMLLLDCGEATQIPLKLCGWGFKSIGMVLFTHYHADHIAGLPGFLLTLGNSGREEPLTLIGRPGLEAVVKSLLVIAPRLPFGINFVELPDNQVTHMEYEDIYISSMPVDHWLPCLAYSFETKRLRKFDRTKAESLKIPVQYWKRLHLGETVTFEDKVIKPEMVTGEHRNGVKLSYCTDSRPVTALAEFIKGSDLFICEGMYGDKDESPKAIEKKHMLFSEAAMLAQRGEVKELWLTHYSPSLKNPGDHITRATAVFENSIAAGDLMKKSIRPQA